MKKKKKKKKIQIDTICISSKEADIGPQHEQSIFPIGRLTERLSQCHYHDYTYQLESKTHFPLNHRYYFQCEKYQSSMKYPWILIVGSF